MKKKRQRNHMYGKFYHDTLEFRKALSDLFSNFLENHRLDMRTHNDMVELRNRIVALLNSWIGSKKLESKFGIKMPLHTTPPSIENFLERQARSYHRTYRPCEICGENRVTHYCHIIPLSEGGPSDAKNYVYLCPTHHHLFDHNRLDKEEWQKLDFSEKLEASQEYAEKIRLPILEKFWLTKKEERTKESEVGK